MSEVADSRERSRFEISVDGRVAGFAAYRRVGDVMEFTHTEIDPDFEGQGLASTLVRAALDDVRRQGLQVRPFCPFVRRYLSRHQEYVDLVSPADRSRFDLPAAESQPG